MNKKSALLILFFLLSASSASHAGWFSFSFPAWSLPTPTKAFFGICSFIRERMPIVTKAEVKAGQEKAVRVIDRKFNESNATFKTTCNDAVDTSKKLLQQAQELNDQVKELDKKSLNCKQDLDNLMINIAALTVQLRNSDKSINAIETTLSSQIKDNENQIKILTQDLETFQANHAKGYKKLQAQNEQQTQGFLAQIAEMGRIAQKNHDEFMQAVQRKPSLAVNRQLDWENQKKLSLPIGRKDL